MGVLTLTHTFNTAKATALNETFRWHLPNNIGKNILILKSFTTTFACPFHGHYNGRISCPTLFPHWGINSFASTTIGSGTVATNSHDIDLRWDGTSNVSHADVHLLVGKVDAVHNYMDVVVSSDWSATEFFSVTGDTTASATDYYVAAAGEGKAVTLTLVFEYNDQRAS